MLASDFRISDPSIPESPFDRAVLGLLDALPHGSSATIGFDSHDCPVGMAMVETLGCCWYFGGSPMKVIERLSLGRANAWRLDWICEPGSGAANRSGLVNDRSGDINARHPTQPWNLLHADVGLSVFPTGGFTTLLRGESALTLIPAGTLIGRVSYSPVGKKFFDPGNLSYAVAHVFQGFELMFSCMEEAASRQFGLPKFFIGDAPEKRMCHFLKHFDFDILDGGDLGATVVAPVGRVRASLDRNRPRWERITARVARDLT